MRTAINKSAQRVSEVTEEACFQLEVAKEYLVWVGAVARAMKLNATHGEDNFDLMELCKFLTDTALPGVESSISEFAAMTPGTRGSAQ